MPSGRDLLLLAALLPAAGGAAGAPAARDGLAEGEGRELVRAHCTGCHSAQLIVQNAGGRAVWRGRLAWMRESQGMPALEAAVEEAILDYLAARYGQKAAARRAALPAHLMPDNPWPADP